MTKESRLSFVIANSELEGMHCPPDEIKHYEDIIEGRATAAEQRKAEEKKSVGAQRRATHPRGLAQGPALLFFYGYFFVCSFK